MKARFHPIVLSLACAWFLGSASAQVPANPPYVFLAADDPAFAEVRRLGERTADQAGGALIMELRRLSATASTAQVVGAVHLKNYKLPASAPGRPRVIAVRRTSNQIRDPANNPDAADQAALDRIRAEIEGGDEVSSLLLQRVTLPGQREEWRFYRPLVLLKQCVDCHGKPSALAPGVEAALAQLYPQDKAVGYNAGQWRGLLRVSLLWPAD